MADLVSSECTAWKQASRLIERALILLDAVGEPGHAPASELSRRLLPTLRGLLDLDARRFLGVTVLLSLPEEHQVEIMTTRLQELGGGMPPPPFLDLRAEASLWAASVSQPELRAVLGAAWRALPNADRDAFLRAVHDGRLVA